jgi:glycosyltransferase involved in cell wall biosynthesis
MLLSAALMVKNEQKYLEQCLKTLCSFIPDIQIIILDTGSTDDTVKIAQKYTKLIYHQPWQDNFALHRNKSFSYCTGDWILQIDADEQMCYPQGGSAEMLLDFLKKVPEDIHAVGMPLKDWRKSENRYSAEFDVVRIFRRGKMHWKRRVHNEAIYEGVAAYYPMSFLKHWGYDLNEEQKKAKAKRTITLLNQSLKEDPSDYQSYFYLSQAHCAWLDDDETALKNAHMYVDFKGLLGKNFNPSIYHLVIGIYMKNKDYENAIKWINMGLAHNVQNIDVCYDLLQLGLNQSKAEYIAIGAQKYVAAMENLQKNRLNASGQFFFSNTPTHYCLALHYLTTALFEKATIELAKLKHVLPKCSTEIQKEINSKLSEFTKALGWEKIEDKGLIITPEKIRQETQI